MDIVSENTDHITEVLSRILEFTERRREVLSRNIFDYQNPDFIPMDLPAQEFAHCMTRAISEHLCRDRLLFCDSANVRFEENGKFDTLPVCDIQAMELMKTDPRQYLRRQIQSLSENMMNNRIAAELLRKKRVKNDPCSSGISKRHSQTSEEYK